MTLSGCVVVVAGASKGIGRAIVLRAAADGASVVINYMSDVKGANALVAQIGSDRAIAVRADISKTAEVDELIEATVARFGRIDVLVPNAAYVPESDLRSVTEEDFDRAFAVNVKGPCFLAKAGAPRISLEFGTHAEILPSSQKALPYMQPGSTIIFISTDLTDASSVPPHFLLYVSTKGAMNQMVKVLARDLAGAGIRVNAVSPGATSTASFHKAMDETRVQMIASHNPFNRIAEPDEIAAAFPDPRTQKLRSLLEQGHVTVAPLRDPELILHSHLPHLLGSAYALGADSDQLTRTYEHEITQLVPIARGFIRGEAISKENWRDFLTRKEYTMAYQDFFDNEVKEKQGDWGKVLEEYLYSGTEPLVNGCTGGLGHPFIHLAYAYEFRSKEVAAQALSQGCTEYNAMHTVLDQAPPDTSKYKTTSLAEVFEKVRQDPRLDDLFSEPGIANLDVLSQEQNIAVVLEHWNAWEITDLVAQFEECCDLAVVLALSNGNRRDSFDFFNAHIMTVAHALRVLWHYVPTDRRASILKQYALFGIMTYICQLRPRFSLDWIDAVEVDGRDWNWVVETALAHKWALDAHFFKVVRAPKVFQETFGRKDDFYLKAAIKYVTEFAGWKGYGQGVAGFIPSRDGYRPE
ncbi:hypothetical protein KXV68_000231 [Aspergillus fumigatus]|nr:hypothetical protein KXX67_007609 [Aspergillus fumigatus]KAH1671814.1 hypothetical protein KXX15_003477 [Aspergillus fumigatus]KAH2158101.1 hypothetical protein KXV68_000231 [Aspergillus fumigatus]KAH2356620.1 hypothetical protein KXW91_005434 [Aspergillus fumigatus]